MHPEKKYYLFFDEIQMVEEFERVINSFRATAGASIFITGSNSKLLSGELATLLSGRYVSFIIRPFNFREYCEIKKITADKVTEKVLLDFLEWGGMPQRFLMPDKKEQKVFLNDIYNSIVLKDICQRTGAKDIDLLNRIVEYLVLNPDSAFLQILYLNFLKVKTAKCLQKRCITISAISKTLFSFQRPDDMISVEKSC